MGAHPMLTVGVMGFVEWATKCPLFPPRFSINRTPSMIIPRSTALHMS